MEDAGVSPDSGVLSKKKDVHVDKIPTEADFLTVYSTVPGKDYEYMRF